MNVSGIVVACRPDDMSEVSASLDAISWAELHYREPDGRMVVTIEAADEEQEPRSPRTTRIPRRCAASRAEGVAIVPESRRSVSPLDMARTSPSVISFFPPIEIRS